MGQRPEWAKSEECENVPDNLIDAAVSAAISDVGVSPE